MSRKILGLATLCAVAFVLTGAQQADAFLFNRSRDCCPQVCCPQVKCCKIKRCKVRRVKYCPPACPTISCPTAYPTACPTISCPPAACPVVSTCPPATCVQFRPSCVSFRSGFCPIPQQAPAQPAPAEDTPPPPET